MYCFSRDQKDQALDDFFKEQTNKHGKSTEDAQQQVQIVMDFFNSDAAEKNKLRVKRLSELKGNNARKIQ